MLRNKKDKQAFEDWYGEDDMNDNGYSKGLAYDAFVAGLEHGKSESCANEALTEDEFSLILFNIPEKTLMGYLQQTVNDLKRRNLTIDPKVYDQLVQLKR